MAILNIPAITAPSFGGFVYSLDFSRSYSTEACKLTYKVVSKSGAFSTPTIGSQASVSFGSFSFNGRIFSYEKSESNSGNILSVTLIDNSTILDRLHVVVFRPGIFNKTGTSSNKSLDVKFTSEDNYYWQLELVNGLYKPVKKILTNSSVSRTIRTGNVKVGDLLIVGSEEPPDTKCEVASTSYVFNDLKNLAGVQGLSSCPISDSTIRKTYEGTLRSVLNSWCQDFGYSFYWDYSLNSLAFFDLKNSVFTIPENVIDGKITSKTFSESAEGKFNQISANYYIKPYNPKVENLSDSRTQKTSYSLNPIAYSYFIDRELASGQTTIYGGGRSQQQFMESAVCGYLSPALRDIYNFSYKGESLWGANCGFVSSSYSKLNVAKVAGALTASSYGEEIYNMCSFSDSDIDGLGTYYDCVMVKYDEGIIESWRNIESDIFTSKIGAYYRGVPVISSEYKFCSKNSIFSSSISVDPEAEIYEDSDTRTDKTLAGLRVFNRGGSGPNVTSAEALKKLGIDDGADYIKGLLPTKHVLRGENSVASVLLAYGLLTTQDLKNYDTIVFIPKKTLIDYYEIKFSVSYTQGNNDREQTWREVSSSRKAEPGECKLNDITEKACLSARDEVIEKQKSQANPNQQLEIFTGLDHKTGIGARVGAFGASVTVLSSSTAPYIACITASSSIELVVDTTQQESIVFESSGSTSSQPQDLMETRFILENRTIADNLRETPTPSDLASRTGYVQNNNIRKVSYSCAGFVDTLPMGPSSGLENLDMSISDSGFSATYSYSTRPAIFGKQDLSRVNVGSNPSNPSIQLR
jgi:hypothetical protein